MFSTLSIDKVGSGYTLTVAASGLATVPSAPFNIGAGAATRLVLSVQPSNATAGASIAPAVQVTAQDAQGNTATAFTATVTLAIGTNPGGGTLSGTTAVAAAGGVATFPGLSINKAGVGYTLAATATGVTGATSAAFTVTPGAATQLAFTIEPTNTAAGASITPAVQVTAQDGLGNTDPTFTGNVTVALGANPSGGTLSGTASVVAVSGVATFSNLSINKAGSGYTLTAAATGPAGMTSTPFDVFPGAATHLAFTVPPSTTPANATITPPIQVTALDVGNNVTTAFTGNVVMAIPASSNPGAGTLSGTKTVAAVAGIATFSDLSINNPGTGYRLRASSTGLTGISSAQFNITAVTQLVFTVEPGNIAAGGTMTPAVQVTAEDAAGRVATGFTGNVAVAIGANPGGGALTGTKTVAAVAGVATFGDLSVDKAGTGYTLTAAATGLTSPTSAAFNVSAGGATHLVFAVQPGNTTAGSAVAPAVQIAAQDAQGNTDPTFTGNVTVAIGTNPGGGTLAGTTSVAAVNGVATFANVSIDKVGTGYTLAASATGPGGATSTAFNITPAAASHLVFSAQPTTTTAGSVITPAVQVTAQDAQGNTASGFTGNVSVAIGTNPGGGTLSGTATAAAVGGVVSFGSLSIDKAGTGYTLATRPTGLTGATRSTLNLAPGAANRLVFTGQPTSVTAGAAITPPPAGHPPKGARQNCPRFSREVGVGDPGKPAGGAPSRATARAAGDGRGTF